VERRMSTPVQAIPSRAAPRKPVAPVQKEDAMLLQKELINRNYHELATAREMNRKPAVVYRWAKRFHLDLSSYRTRPPG